MNECAGVLAILANAAPPSPNIKDGLMVVFEQLQQVKLVVVLSDIRLRQHGIIDGIIPDIFVHVRRLSKRAQLIISLLARSA
jgi:hypothetical protein